MPSAPGILESPLRLVVVGGGELSAAVASWATRHPSVTMAGHVSRPEVSRILAASRAVVVPSQWEETFGMVAVEAMAAGTAPVASAHGAFPELVTHGSDGALFPPTDINALVDILADIDDNPQRWDAYGQQARQTYRSRFSPDAGIDRLLEIYRFAVEHPIELSGRSKGIAGRSDRSRGADVTTLSTDAPPAPAESGRHGVIQAARRLGWGVADQGISSLSNFALGLFVARSFGASNFGAFTLAFITYTVVINAARGLATDPLLVRFSGDLIRRWRRATSAATGTALVVGVAAGVVCIVAGLLLPDPVGPAFVALGIGLPGLALQDSWRFAFFARGRGSSAFINDLFWSVLLVLALVLMHGRGRQRSALSARLRRHRHARRPAGDGSGENPATPNARAGMAPDPPRAVCSVPCRERQHQRRIPAALLRAGRGGRPRGCRLRPGL